MSLCAATVPAPFPGAVLLMPLSDRRTIWVEGHDAAERWLAPPGSTIKPFSLLALLETGRLKPQDQYVCPGKLVLNGRSLNCSHPQTPLPMNPARAIAYSCNCAVAHFAQRFAPDELSAFLVRTGFSSATGLTDDREATGEVARVPPGPLCQMQALGEYGIRVTALELLTAYARLTHRSAQTQMAPILEGLEGAVEFGTAQGARLDKVRVAGKTGSVQTAPGAHAAWFAGFAPSRKPQVVVTVLVQGRSGAADAAPVAGKILRDYFARTA